jgi:hemerythrin
MDDDRRAFREAWEHRVAVRRFQSAFEAADRLPEADRQLLLEQVGEWLLQHIPNVPAQEQKAAEVESIQTNQVDAQPLSGRDDDPPGAA